MRILFTSILSTFIWVQAYSTEQVPDYLILEGDTVPIFNNPLEQYFEQVGHRELPGFENPCWSTACWRGYKALWKIKGDSLFLLQIGGCHDECDDGKNANLELMFGSGVVYAYWYTGVLTIPMGEYFAGFHMGYSAIYEYEIKIEIAEGLVKNSYTKPNHDLIERITLDRQLANRVDSLGDTLLFYLSRSMDWEAMYNSKNFWCDDTYLLFYNKEGNLEDIKLVMYHSDTTSAADIRFDRRLERRCTKKMKKSLGAFSLSYIESHKPFIVKIDLWYDDDGLEMWECGLHYDISDEDISDWIKKQMDLKE